MKTWVVLLRGINVGGHNKLKMADLRALLTSLDYQNPRTYIQSGNVIFDVCQTTAKDIEANIHTAIKSKFGIDLPVFALTMDDLETVIEKNPFDVSEDDSKSVHIFFLRRAAKDADLEKIESLKKPGEEFALTDTAFYLHAPGGIGRSKLAAGTEKCLGVPVTARNLRSAKKIIELTNA